MPAGFAGNVDARQGASPNSNLLIFGAVAVGVAVVGGIFLLRPFLTTRDSQPDPSTPAVVPGSDVAGENKQQNDNDSAEIPCGGS